MVIANKNLVEFAYYLCCLPCPHTSYEFADFFAFPVKFLLAGFPLHPEFTAPAFRAVMCKSQKSKRFRLLSFVFAVFLCKASKLDEPCLVLFQFHSKVSHPAFQPFVEHFCFSFVLKTQHKIVSIDH